MTKNIKQTYAMAYDNRAKITSALITICLIMVFAYALNVYLVISRTVAVQKVRGQIMTLESEVEDLDSQYLALLSEITPDSLKQYGFVQGKVSAYISRNTRLGRVVISGHEL
jgi:cell division protein FtsL